MKITKYTATFWLGFIYCMTCIPFFKNQSFLIGSAIAGVIVVLITLAVGISAYKEGNHKEFWKSIVVIICIIIIKGLSILSFYPPSIIFH